MRKAELGRALELVVEEKSEMGEGRVLGVGMVDIARIEQELSLY